MSGLVVASISLMSAVTVAILSHIFAMSRNRGDELAQMRLKAYTDFINSGSRLVSARRIGVTDDELEELAALNDAKARICICGDSEVVKHLIKFWNAGGTLEREREILAFSRLCLKMRESLGNKAKELSSTDISNTLFRLEPSSYSYRAAKEKAANELA